VAKKIEDLERQLTALSVQVQDYRDRNRKLDEENVKLKELAAWKDLLWAAVSLGMDRAMQTVLNNERRVRMDKERFSPWHSTGKTGVKLMWDLIAEEVKGIGASKFPTFDEERLEQPGEKEREQNEAQEEALKIEAEKKA
jgi:hypothetical protein